MSAADMSTGFFGKIPATGDFVSANLPRTFIDRWDRWMSMELRARPDEGELDSRVWRFIVKGGIFGDQPCAGAWRMSEDRVGRRYPFAVIRLGPPPEPGDPWFDGIADLVRETVEAYRAQAWIAERIDQLPQPETLDGKERIAFWLDDWEVHELDFADIHDLAANGLPAMRATRPETAES
ncbi:type VI secretion system-associated protein TagF [Mesorhizobium sp. VK4C]|uniref:type VI secretion system-associated protein TagF n=1 Tax=Mesorhizobium captivum TaxID=3072319 RepID=UPI002A2441A2|nr:type VI secretion system-associated protein TagF [Mesorhizobium sp. VK4C]MDX8500500.1 type VI secretion system-associated protein TagF [Mesorhizobium sp. VK4C]